MKAKTFDCVEMKQQAQASIYKEIKNLNDKELLLYWQTNSKTLSSKRSAHISAKKRTSKFART